MLTPSTNMGGSANSNETHHKLNQNPHLIGQSNTNTTNAINNNIITSGGSQSSPLKSSPNKSVTKSKFSSVSKLSHLSHNNNNSGATTKAHSGVPSKANY